MTDAEGALTCPLLPLSAWRWGRGGRPEKHCRRRIVDAIRYVVDNGRKWRALPADFPPHTTVYSFFVRWARGQFLDDLHDKLRDRLRQHDGRATEPTAGVIDSQSPRAAETVGAASRGYDAGKNSRKRHIAVDTLGLLLTVMVTAASVKDNDAGRDLLEQLRAEHRHIALVWADGGYTGWLVAFAATVLAPALTVVKRSDDAKGFEVLPRRWVVERSFSWLIRAWRLARDYETRIDSAEAMAWWAASIPATRRLARSGAPAPRRLKRSAA
jgi:transposase